MSSSILRVFVFLIADVDPDWDLILCRLQEETILVSGSWAHFSISVFGLGFFEGPSMQFLSQLVLLLPSLGGRMERVPHGLPFGVQVDHAHIWLIFLSVAVLQALTRGPVLRSLHLDPGLLSGLAIVMVRELDPWASVILRYLKSIREPSWRHLLSNDALFEVDLL